MVILRDQRRPVFTIDVRPEQTTMNNLALAFSGLPKPFLSTALLLVVFVVVFMLWFVVPPSVAVEMKSAVWRTPDSAPALQAFDFSSALGE